MAQRKEGAEMKHRINPALAAACALGLAAFLAAVAVIGYHEGTDAALRITCGKPCSAAGGVEAGR